MKVNSWAAGKEKEQEKEGRGGGGEEGRENLKDDLKAIY